MDIQIKNVTGHPSNDGCIFELQRAGFPEGTIVYDVRFDQRNKAFYWTSVNDNCVAYLNETCIIYKKS